MATRFRFRLQPLLKLRKSLEEEAQRHLARTLDVKQAAEARVAELQQLHLSTADIRRAAPGEVLDLQRWRAAERYLVVLERMLLEARQAVIAAEHRVAEARVALKKAHQAHMTIERLKERRKEQHEFEQLQEELRAMDELAVLRYRFNTKG